MLPNFYTPHPLGKGIVCFSGAAIMTVAIFALMQYLITSPNSRVSDIPSFELIEIVKPREETQAGTIRRVPPPPPVPEVPKPGESKPIIRPNTPPAPSASFIPDISVDHINTYNIGWDGLPDGAAKPLRRANPVYPPEAAKSQIAGWVKVTFTISKTGKVVNAQIIDAEPKNIFDQAALNAVKDWQYRPRVVDGKPVPLTDQSVMLEFNVSKKR